MSRAKNFFAFHPTPHTENRATDRYSI